MTNKPRPQLQPGETRAYPVLPLRDIVVFPHMTASSGERNFVRLFADELFEAAEKRLQHRLDPL